MRKLNRGRSNKIESETSVTTEKFDSLSIHDAMNKFPDFQLCSDCVNEKRHI